MEWSVMIDNRTNQPNYRPLRKGRPAVGLFVYLLHNVTSDCDRKTRTTAGRRNPFCLLTHSHECIPIALVRNFSN